MLYFFWILVVIVSLTYGLAGQDAKTVVSGKKQPLPVTFAASIGQIYGVGNSTFFRDYRFRVGGRSSEFTVPTELALAYKIEPWTGVRTGVNVAYYKTGFVDTYTGSAISLAGDTVGSRNVRSDFSCQVFPATVGIEYLPSKTQFRTYGGAGLGLAYCSVQWDETLTSSSGSDPRTGGTLANERGLAPVGTVYTGVELGFDEHRAQESFIGLVAELRYTYIGFAAPVLEKLQNQVFNAPAQWGDNVDLGLGGISFRLGLVFQFHHSK